MNNKNRKISALPSFYLKNAAKKPHKGEEK